MIKLVELKYCPLCKRNVETTGRKFNAAYITLFVIITLFVWWLGILLLAGYVFYVKVDKVEECPICRTTNLEMVRIPSESVAQPIVVEVPEGDISERMAKLKELYDKKLITEEEYNKRKSELLSKI